MSNSSPLSIDLVAYEGVQRAALYGLTDLFAVANQQGRSQDDLPQIHVTVRDRFTPPWGQVPAVVIIPPTLAEPPAPAQVPDLLAWLKHCHEQGSIIASLCAGTFLLAATGLLDGRPATTHWRAAGRLAARFPAIHVDADRLLVDDGDILTVAGVMSWPDLGLRLVEKLLGPAVMVATARFLLIDPPRREQRLYRPFAPPLTHGNRAILKVQHWLRSREARTTTVADMARLSGLEERTFLRHFKKTTGMTPVDYIQHLRVEKGRDLLETSVSSLERIAWEAGYQDAGAFRKVFMRLIGLSPAEYRRRFGQQAPADQKRR